MSKKNKSSNQKEYKALVAIDFAQCSAHALESSKLIMDRRPDKIFALHVIDHDFIEKCIDSGLGTESQIKKSLFVEAKTAAPGKIPEGPFAAGVPFLMKDVGVLLAHAPMFMGTALLI